MATSFSRTLRALNDGAPRHIRVVAVVLALLAGWVVWALAGRVSIVAVSKRARFESRRAVRQIAIPVNGRITSINIALGQRVHRGDVLIELDTADVMIRRGKAVADIDHLRRRIEKIAAMMFTHAKCVQSDLVGMLDLLNELSETGGRIHCTTIPIECGGEAIDTDLHL